MATLDTEKTFDTENTHGRLIAASKVNGTTIYDASGAKLGSVYDLMLDKVSGRPDYAIMSIGGFLGMGARYHPLPWNELKYDTRLEGYVVGVDRTRLEGAPSYDEDELSAWDDVRSNDIDTYYGTQPGYEAGGVAGPGLGSRLDR